MRLKIPYLVRFLFPRFTHRVHIQYEDCRYSRRYVSKLERKLRKTKRKHCPPVSVDAVITMMMENQDKLTELVRKSFQ